MISKNRLGLVVSGFFGLWHLVWSLLVAIGAAQTVTSFVFRLHFIQPPYVIAPFRADLAVALIVITATVGYVGGWVFAAIWNCLRPVS